MKEMKIIYKKVADIIPYENNPRNNEKAVDYVANSIKQFGFKNPIIIDKENVIVAGHTRLKAAEKLGIEEVPCIMADDLNEEQIKAFRLADNKVSEIATWDLDKLDLELEDINIDMSEFGFGDINIELDEEYEEDEEEEDGPENIEESNFNYKEQYGVIVMCKDSADQEKVYNKLASEGYECKVVTV